MAKKSPRVPASPRESEKEDGNPALVPKLRFPEFRGTEAWKANKLARWVQLVSGIHLSPERYSEEGLVPYFTGPSDFTNNSQDITKRTSDSTNLAKENDTLITVKGSGVGEIWYLTLPSVAIGRQLMALRAIDASSRFIFQLLLTKRQRFEDLAAGNLIPGLSRGDILDLESPFPSLPEQRKIADCLSSLDELIGAQGRKVDALRTHKKGLMQQLFPREGETRPRLRFPEFQHAGEWEIRKAGTLFKNRITKGEHGLPIYSVTMHDGIVRRDSIDRNFYDIEEASGNKKACRNDIVYNMMRMWQGALGVASEDCLVSPAYIVLEPTTDAVPNFFQYIFKLPATLLLLMSHSRGLTKDRLRLYYDDFARIPLNCPGPVEQQRICSMLSSLDDLITAETQKIEALKTHKRGLMQQLFPSPEEN